MDRAGFLRGLAATPVTGFAEARGDSVQSVEGLHDVRSHGAAGDGVQDDGPGIEAAIDAAISSGGGTIYFPPGRYRVQSTIRRESLPNLIFRGEGSAATGTTSPNPTTIDVDVPGGYGFDLGTTQRSAWAGPAFRHLTFRDVTSGRNSAGALYFRRMNNMQFDGCNWANFESGDAMTFDGTGDWCQYITFFHPRVQNCLRGIVKIGRLSDITLIGGDFRGQNFGAQIREGSVGIDDVSGDGGHLNIFGTDFNNWQSHIVLRGWGAAKITAGFEQGSSFPATGTGVLLLGASDAGQGRFNAFIGCDFVNLETAFDIRPGAKQTHVVAPTYASCNTTLLDEGSGTTVLSGGDQGLGDAGGFRYGFQNPAGGSWHQLALLSRNGDGNLSVNPVLVLPQNRGLLLRDSEHGYEGGLYLMSDAADRGLVGTGVVGDLLGPRASGASSSFLLFAGGNLQFHSAVRTEKGDLVPLSESRRAGFGHPGFVEIADRIPEPPEAEGFGRIYVDEGDGDLKIKFGDGRVRRIVLEGE